MKTKICPKCKEEKSFSDFGPDKNRKYGLKSYCRICSNLVSKKIRQKYKTHPKKIPTSKRCPSCEVEKSAQKFFNSNSTKDGLTVYCKECFSERVKAYRKTPAGKITQKKHNNSKGSKASRRRYRLKWSQTERGKEYMRKVSLERYYKDPKYYRLKSSATRLGSTTGILKQVVERDNDTCQLCGATEDLQFDHIHPASMGGKGTLENLQLLCAPCNNFKSNNLFLPGGGMIVTKKSNFPKTKL